MPDFQTAEELTAILVGRSFRFFAVTNETKTGRAMGLAFVDIETGEAVGVMTMFGAIEAHVVNNQQGYPPIPKDEP